jgi:hypothetical protein
MMGRDERYAVLPPVEREKQRLRTLTASLSEEFGQKL